MLAALLVLAAGAASPPATIADMAVATNRGPQKVIVQTRSFEAGATSGWHVHPGTEIAHVVSGELDLVTAAGVQRLQAGDSFVMPPGTAHNGVNHSTVPAKVVITLVIDANAPARQPVAAPR